MSWEQLQNIAQEAREEHMRELNEPPVACPFDGEPLDINDRGVRNCPLGNYRWEGGAKVQPPRA